MCSVQGAVISVAVSSVLAGAVTECFGASLAWPGR